MSTEAPAQRVIDEALARHVFPAAVAEIGDAQGVLWSAAAGRLTFDEDAPAATVDTVFDLASLTKPLATAAVAMALVDDARLRLDEPIASCFDDWRGADREQVSVTDLLEHASGLPARLVDPPPDARREFEHDICTIPLEYPPRTASVYSDLGFILLGFIAERRGGASLDRLFDDLWQRASVGGLAFRGSRASGATDRRHVFAPTMPLPDDRRKRRLVGEVHDTYAFALGGVAGHAGLFGTSASVGAAARVVLGAARGDRGRPRPFTPALVERFTRRTLIPGSSRALGWDTMLPTSSCGTRMSDEAFGHVGFTGTSLWIDPPRNRYFVLLTNRVCGGGSLDEMRVVRRAFHDAFP